MGLVSVTPYWENGVTRLYQADARALPLPDESVHCVVTSPPYWGLRDYKLEPQVWGGSSGCAHTWDRELLETETGGGNWTQAVNGRGEVQPGGPEAKREAVPIRAVTESCEGCGAWLGTLGLEPTVELYIAHLVEVFREVRRVLRKDGTVWLNLGDAYANDGKWGGATGGKQAYLPDSDREMSRQKRATGLKPKDLIGLPWRVAFALQTDGVADVKALGVIERVRTDILDEYMERGETPPDRVLAVLERLDAEYAEAKGDSWWLRSDIVWDKPNPMPESMRDRPTRAHEYVFLLTRSARYYYDGDAVRQPVFSGLSDLRKIAEAKDRIGCKHKTLDDPLSKASSATNIGRKRAVGDPSGRNLRTVWTIATEPYKGSHFATYPQKLVEPCILAGTSEKGVCGECGAPRNRVVNRRFKPQGDVSEEKGIRSAGSQKPLDASNGWSGYPRGTTEAETLGWQPTCDHDAPVVPATVLDPFVGSGTTLAVAQRLGRLSLGVDLNPNYLDMAAKRIGKLSLPMRFADKGDRP